MVALVSLVAVLLALLPDLYSWWLAQRQGEFWTGAQFLVPEDIGVYLNYIDQAKRGELLFANRFSAEQLLPVAHPFWLLVGWGAWLLSLSAVTAYHAARLVVIPALVVFTYLSLAFFLTSPRRRLVALLLFVFGSGLGVYFAPLFDSGKHVPGLLNLPVDLWVADANPFLSLLYSPHFVVSWMLIILALVLIYWAFVNGRLGYAVAAGLCSAALLSFHPYHAPTLFCVPLAYLLLLKARRQLNLKQVRQLTVLYGLSAPALAYHFYLTHYSSHSAQALITNSALSPHPIHIVLGFGLVLLLAVVGYLGLCSRSLKRDAKWDYLAVWVVVQFLLLYSPLTFQRRLIEGLWFPLVVLAVLGLVWLYNHVVRTWLPDRRYVLTRGLALLLVVCFSSNVYVMYQGAARIRLNQPPMFRLSVELSDALFWLKGNVPTDAVVLSDYLDGHFIAGLANRQVYVGHWGNTLEFAQKERIAQEMIYAADPEDRQQFMNAYGITHILARRDRWAEVDDPSLMTVYRNDQVVILTAVIPE